MRLNIFSSFLALALVACGSKKTETAPPAPSARQALQTALERVEPQLLFCDGVVATEQPNNLTGQPNCGTGDALFNTSLYYAMTDGRTANSADLRAGILASIDAEGRTWRSPQYKGIDPIDSSSRDQVLGALLFAVKTKDADLVNRIWSYLETHNYEACAPVSPDHNCSTISIFPVFHDVMTFLGIDPPVKTTFNRSVDEELRRANANTLTGYELHLVSITLYIRALTGHNSESYAKTAQIIADRQSNNMWYAWLANYMNSGKAEEYTRIEQVVTTCLNQWDATQSNLNWSYGHDMAQQCDPNSMGHELVGVGYLLK